MAVTQTLQERLNVLHSWRFLAKELAQLLEAQRRASHVGPMETRLTVSSLEGGREGGREGREGERSEGGEGKRGRIRG